MSILDIFYTIPRIQLCIKKIYQENLLPTKFITFQKTYHNYLISTKWNTYDNI